MLMRMVMLVLFCITPGLLQARANPPVVHLSLKDVLERSMTISVHVLVANARIDQALAQVDQSRSSLLPQISAMMNGQRQSKDLRTSGIAFPAMPNYTGPFNSFDARARMTQTIFDLGTLERLKTARFNQQLSLTELQKAREDVLALVAILYIQAKRAKELKDSMELFLIRDRMTLKLFKTEYAEGAKTLLELVKAKAVYAHSLSLLKNARIEAKERCLDLQAALMIDPGVKVVFDLNEDMTLLTHRYLKIPSRSLEHALALDQWNVAKAQVEQSKADLLPRVSLIGDYGRAGENPRKASNTYTLGLLATMPIWQGGSQQAKLAEAKAKVVETQVIMDDTKNQSIIKVIVAKENILKAQSMIKSQYAEMDVSAQQLSVMKQQYNDGSASLLDLVKARAQDGYDRDQYRESIAVLWTALIALAKVQGQMQAMLL